MSEIKITRGSGNVFRDLGLPDAEDHMLKAELVMRLAAIVKTRKLTQSAAAAALGIGQPDLSKILKGQFRQVSVERLLRFHMALGQDVAITLRDKGRVKRPARLSVAAE
jgi:predicted XRE-type DNA-binding protein